MALSGAQITRLGPCAVPRQVYGSFAGKEATEAVATVAGGPPGRRRYTLPDGRRVQANKEEIRKILEEYRSATERDLSKIELPPEVEQVVASASPRTQTPPSAPSVLMSSLVELAEEVGPQLVMEVTDDLTREEAIALGRMIEAIDDDEAVVALLLLN